VFQNIVISVEDCFEILVGMKAFFPTSGFRHTFEMAHSGGVVDRDFLIFAHGVIDITGKHHFLPFLVNLNHSKAAWLGAARVHCAATKLQIPCSASYQAGCKKNGVPGMCGGFNISGYVLTQHI
jgi:hypothetical protein